MKVAPSPPRATARRSRGASLKASSATAPPSLPLPLLPPPALRLSSGRPRLEKKVALIDDDGDSDVDPELSFECGVYYADDMNMRRWERQKERAREREMWGKRKLGRVSL